VPGSSAIAASSSAVPSSSSPAHVYGGFCLEQVRHHPQQQHRQQIGHDGQIEPSCQRSRKAKCGHRPVRTGRSARGDRPPVQPVTPVHRCQPMKARRQAPLRARHARAAARSGNSPMCASSSERARAIDAEQQRAVQTMPASPATASGTYASPAPKVSAFVIVASDYRQVAARTPPNAPQRAIDNIGMAFAGNHSGHTNNS